MGLPDFQAETLRLVSQRCHRLFHELRKTVIQDAGQRQVETAVLQPRLQQWMPVQPVQGLADDLPVQPFYQVKAFGDGQELVRCQWRRSEEHTSELQSR